MRNFFVGINAKARGCKKTKDSPELQGSLFGVGPNRWMPRPIRLQDEYFYEIFLKHRPNRCVLSIM